MDSSNPEKEASEAAQDKESEVSREKKASEAPTEANKGKKKTIWEIQNFVKDSSDFEEMTTPEQGTSVASKEKKASEAPAKKGKKKFANIWVLKALKQRNGDLEEEVIGAYSSLDKAIRSARRTMEGYNGQGFEDNSETIGEDGGVVFRYRYGYYEVSIDKVSLDKRSSCGLF